MKVKHRETYLNILRKNPSKLFGSPMVGEFCNTHHLFEITLLKVSLIFEQ